jgi:hypothetical protein
MASVAQDWRSRVDALLQAGRDIREEPSRQVAVRLGPAHAALHTEYVRDLRKAKQWAESWWQSVIKTETTRAENAAAAERQVRARFPGRPVGHGSVIAALRKYWLACDSINETSPPDEWMAAEEFLLGTLVGSPDQDLAEFLADLQYWPIGMDANGRWV